jgi:hypothetical protein
LALGIKVELTNNNGVLALGLEFRVHADGRNESAG